MKIFVTGGTGFIGRAFCRVALERGHHLLALCRSAVTNLSPDVEIATGSLAETPWAQVARFSPDAVLHLAWVATPGVYLTSPENEMWLQQSKAWFQRLHDIGVMHIASTGTCIEYAASAEPLKETTSRLDPAFPYSRSKAALFQWLCDEGIRYPSVWSWFRVFYPYGPGEHPHRICSSLIQQLRSGNHLELRTPHSVKDYIFIDDVASAMCRAMESKLTGAINVGTGHGISIEGIALIIANLLNADPKLVQQASEQSHDPNPIVIADNQLLRSIGWCPQTKLHDGLSCLIEKLVQAPCDAY